MIESLPVPDLPGFRVSECLNATSRSVIYRAVRLRDERPVVLKLPANRYATHADRIALRHEYNILRKHSLDRAVPVLDFIDSARGPVLVRDYSGGVNLKEYVRNTRAVTSVRYTDYTAFVSLAKQLALVLSDMHQAGIVHRDVKPANFIVDSEGDIKITDFSFATSSSDPRPEVDQLLLGTLSYIAPEQTGRIHLKVDHRSDLYSLGIVYYELLAGDVPFTSKDSLELIYGHIAVVPPAPRTIYPEVPEALSEIAMKLIAKNPDERYQSAAGLLRDLDQLLSDPRATIVVGASDFDQSFRLPGKLYGREHEIESIYAALDHAAQGTATLLLVSGPSGIGKTAIIDEVEKPLLRARGFYIRGKFDQLQRDIPYASVGVAFRDLLRQVIAMHEQDLDGWRVLLEEQLGPSASLLADVLPDLQHLMKISERPPNLPPAEARNLFNEAFLRLVRVFASPDHPLVLFLDDLQWADAASLTLLQHLLTHSDDGMALLCIGAYRDNETGPDHQLTIAVADIEKKARVERIHPGPLTAPDLDSFLSDALRSEVNEVVKLRDITLRKTGGNPFYISQFLLSLSRDGVIQSCSDYFEWDPDEAERSAFTENVVDLMVRSLRRLDAETQRMLMYAATLGNQFRIGEIAQLEDMDAWLVFENLQPAAGEGLLIPINKHFRFTAMNAREAAAAMESEIDPSAVAFRFLHDRVQQAAFSLIPESDRPEVHVRIGQALLAAHGPEPDSGDLFRIVGHINEGIGKFEAEEALTMARLNLQAATSAHRSAAFGPAAIYARAGFDHIQSLPAHETQELKLNLALLAAECHWSTGDFEDADTMLDAAENIARAGSPMDRVRVLNARMTALTLRGRLEAAVDCGVQALAELKVDFETDNFERYVMRLLRQIQKEVGTRAIADLIELKELEDPLHLKAIEIFVSMTAASFLTVPMLAASATMRIALISMEHGNTGLSAWGYVNVGTTLTSWFAMDEAYAYGQLALRINEKFDDLRNRCKILCMFSFYISHWKRPALETPPILREAIKIGNETGDMVYVSYAWVHLVLLRLQIGAALPDVGLDADKASAFMQRSDSRPGQQVLAPLAWTAESLMGRPTSFEARRFDTLTRDRSAMPFGRHVFLICCMTLSFRLHRNSTETIKLAEEAESVRSYSAGMFHLAEHNFLHTLALIDQDRSRRERAHSSRIEKNLEHMKRWAAQAPENFEHRYYLLQAEVEAAFGDKFEAQRIYEVALGSARNAGYLNNCALIAELAGDFFHRENQDRLATHYYQEAVDAYRAWGALACVERLKKDRGDAMHRWRPGVAGESTSSSSASAALDLASVLKATRAISQEIQMDRLPNTILSIICENSGAERGALILERDRQTMVTMQEGDPVTIEACESLPASVIRYVQRMTEPLIIDDVTVDAQFSADDYVLTHRPRSILCTPIISGGKATAILYLENRLSPGVFSPERAQLVEALASQAGIAIENAALYRDMERRVENRTQELQVARDEAQLLAVLARKANETADLDALLSLVVTAAARLDSNACVLCTVSEDGDKFAVKNILVDELPLSADEFPMRFVPISADLPSWYTTYVHKRTFVIPDVNRVAHLTKEEALFRDTLQFRWFAHVPLLVDETVIGLLAFCGPNPRRLNRHERTFLEQIAAQIAGAVRARTLLDNAQQARLESDRLLANILPDSVASELKAKGFVEPLYYDSVSVLFTDFVGFTAATQEMLPDELVAELDGCFTQFDQVARRNSMEKLKTIGDAYMCAGGLPEINYTHPVDACLTALELARFMRQTREIKMALGRSHWDLRIGIHTGSVTAGVIGTSKFAYDIWGDAVNTASRMESAAEPGRVNISEDTFRLVHGFFDCEDRGRIAAKGKGELGMYYLLRIKPELSSDAEGLIPNEEFQRLRKEMVGY